MAALSRTKRRSGERGKREQINSRDVSHRKQSQFVILCSTRVVVIVPNTTTPPTLPSCLMEKSWARLIVIVAVYFRNDACFYFSYDVVFPERPMRTFLGLPLVADMSVGTSST